METRAVCGSLHGPNFGLLLGLSKREGRGSELSLFGTTSQWVWDNLAEVPRLNEDHARFQNLKSALHHSDDFGDPLAVQAQCAGIALLYALQIRKSSDLDEASWSAQQVVGAIENYLFFAAEVSGYDLPNGYENVLLVRELDKQTEDAHLLGSLNRLDQITIGSIRTRNRLFAVPIAI